MIRRLHRRPLPIRLIVLACWLAAVVSCSAAQQETAVQKSEVDEALDLLTSDNPRDVHHGLYILSVLTEPSLKYVPAIEPLLKADSSENRYQAVTAAARHGADARALRPLLDDSDPDVVVAVVTELVGRNLCPPTDFTHLLRSDNVEIRRQVAETLIRHGIAQRHVRFLLRDQEDQVRRSVALYSLYNGADWRDFTELLRDPAAEVREYVVHAVADAGADESVLTPLLNDPDSEVRISCARAMLRNGKGDIAECVLAIAESDHDSDLAKNLYQSIGPKTRVKITPTFFSWLMGSDRSLADEAQTALEWMASIPNEAVPLLDDLARHRLGSYRVIACELLQCVEDQNLIIPILKRCMRDSDVRVSMAAIESVADQELISLLPELRQLQENNSPFVRIAAAEAIAVLDAEDTKCLEVIATSWDPLRPTIAAQAETALARTGERLAKHRGLLLRIFQAPKWPNYVESLFREPECSPPYGLVEALGKHAPEILSEWATRTDLTQSQKKTLLYLGSDSDVPIDGFGEIVAELVQETGQDEDSFDDEIIVAGFEYFIRNRPSRLVPFLNRPSPDRIRANAIHYTRLVADRIRETIYREPLINILSGDDDSQRWEAADVLANIKGTDAEVIAFLREQLLRYEDMPVSRQSECLNLVAKLKDRAKPLADVLRPLIGSGDEFMEWKILKNLGVDITPAIVARLDHKKAECRADAVSALGELVGEPARPHIVRMLRDKGAYFIFGIETVHQSALNVLAAIGPDLSVIPVLTDLISEEDSDVDSIAELLSEFGPKAKRAISPLMRSIRSDEYPSIEVARAMTRIAPNSPVGLLPLRKRLKQTMTGNSWWSRSFHPEIMELIAELGDRAKPMIPQLRFIVEEHELIHIELRTAAAAALAILEPSEPKWRRFVERYNSANFDTNWVEFLEEKTAISK